jgi:hypothetical protein
MKTVKACVLQEPPCVILEVRQSSVVDGSDFEGPRWGGQTNLLPAYATAIQQHVDFLKDDIVAAEEMRNGRFVQMDIQSSPDVPQKLQQPLSQQTVRGTGVPPMWNRHPKIRPVGTLQGSVDELVLHLLWTEVHELAVEQFAKQEVVQQLRAMSRRQPLDRFQFEYGSAGYQEVHVVLVAEVLKRHFDEHLGLCIGPDTSRDGIAVNVLVQKSSHLVADRKDVIHDAVRNLAKLILIQMANISVDFDGHRLVPYFDRKIDDRNIGCCRFIFLSSIFLS